jgi:membrane-associated protease RseP (regulator of RpoE activity)
MRHRYRAVVLVAVVGLAGCSSLKSDLEDRKHTAAETEREDRLCLGVTVARESAPLTIGLEIVRILKDGPAADAGIEAGDEIRSVAGEPVRTAADLERVLSHVNNDTRKVEVVVAQRGAERICRVNLVTWKRQDSTAASALALDMLDNRRSFTLPLVIDYEQEWVSAERWCQYHGLKLAGPLVSYSDLSVLPVASHWIALFDFERCPSRGAWRLLILTWPVRFTSIAEEDSTLELAPGEEKLTVL